MNPAHTKILFYLNHHPRLKLFMIALASTGLYLVLAIKFPLPASLADPRASWTSLVGNDIPWIVSQVMIYFCLFVLYKISIKQLLPSNSKDAHSETDQPNKSVWVNRIIVFGWLAGCAVLLTSAAAGESHDIFDYVFRGRMMVEYQANPLVDIPKTLSRGHFYLYTAWYKNVDTYGPVWEMASAGVAAAVHFASPMFGGMSLDLPSCPDSPKPCRWLMIYLTGYRLLSIVLTGISAVIIARIMRQVQPVLVSAALAAWLWNPLTLMASAVGGHNDFLMLALFLASLLLLQKEKYFWALLALVLAAHVKLTALIWAPMVFFWLARKMGWRSAFLLAIKGLSAGLIISWVLFLPFEGWSSLPQMLNERTLYFANSFWNVFYRILTDQSGWFVGIALILIHQLPNWLSIAGAVYLPLRYFRLTFKPGLHFIADGEKCLLWRSAVAVGLFYLVGGAFWFQHWYLLWVLAPAVLLVNHSFTQEINPWLGFGALTANFIGGFLLSAFPEGILRYLAYLLIVLVIWGPGLAAYLVDRTSRNKKRPDRDAVCIPVRP